MLFLLQLLPDDSLPINTLAALAVIKQRLSSDYFLVSMSRITVGFLACKEASRQAGRARDGYLHGYFPALVCSHLVVNRRP